MPIETLTGRVREIAALMAKGHSVMHGVRGFTPGGIILRAGKIHLEQGAIPVSASDLDRIEAAGILLNTYEHNMIEGRKTTINLQQRPLAAEILGA